MIVADLHHMLRLERLPLRRTLGRPATRPARRLAGEAWRRDIALELLGQLRLVVARDVRREADVIELAAVVVEAEQQRADHGLAFVVAEATDHAVGAAVILDLLHAVAVARAVRHIASLGDDAIKRTANA